MDSMIPFSFETYPPRQDENYHWDQWPEAEPYIEGNTLPTEMEGFIPGQPSQAMPPVDGGAPLSGGFTQNQPVPAVVPCHVSAPSTALPTWTPQAVQGGVSVWDQQSSVPPSQQSSVPTTDWGFQPVADTMTSIIQNWSMPQQPFQSAPAVTMAPMPARAMGFDGVGMMNTGLAGSLQTHPAPYQPGPPGYPQGAPTDTGLAGAFQSQPTQHQPSGANRSPRAGANRNRPAGRRSAKRSSPPPPSQCPGCKKSQKTLGLDNQRYSRHIERSCPEITFPCDLCGKEYCNKDYIRTHKRISCPVFRAQRLGTPAAQTAQGAQQQQQQQQQQPGLYVKAQNEWVPFP